MFTLQKPASKLEDIKKQPSQPIQRQLDEKELKAIVRLQNRLKDQLSRRHTREKTASDLGKAQSIDIDKQSKINIANIKKRLRQGAYLPDKEVKTLSKEKKSIEVLTHNESRLFEKLLNEKKFIFHHTTNASLLKTILNGSRELIDSKEAQRRGLSVHVATPAFGGCEQNVFFGFGTVHSSLPYFVRNSVNAEGKSDDYATVQVDVDALRKTYKKVPAAFWTSGHFAHYELAYQRKQMPAIKIGDTEFYWRYDVLHEFDLQREKNIKYHHYVRGDVVIEQPIGMEEEIASGSDILPFVAYSFIERLRFIGGDVRAHLLAHPEDDVMIDLLFEKLFRVDDFEVHRPTKVSLDPSYTRVLTPEVRLKMTEAVSTAATKGDISAVEKLYQSDHPLDGYMYFDKFYSVEVKKEDSKREETENFNKVKLPMIAAVEAKQLPMIKWLVSHKANRSLFNNATENKQYIPFNDANHETAIESLSIIDAVLNLNDLGFLEHMLKIGLDVNSLHDTFLKENERLQKELDTKQKFKDNSYNSALSDPVFLSAIKYTKKHNNLAILKKMLELISYSNQESRCVRLLEDVAHSGDEVIFACVKDYIGTKFPSVKIKIDYRRLLNIAANNTNSEMFNFLKQFLAADTEFNNPVNLKKEAIVKFKSGNYVAADWFLNEAKLSPTAVPEIREWIHTYLGQHSTSQEFIRWVIDSAKVQPLEPLPDDGMVESTIGDPHPSLFRMLIQRNPENAKWLMEERHLDLAKNTQEHKALARDLVSKGDISLLEYFIKQGLSLTKDPLLLGKAVSKPDMLKWLSAKKLFSDKEICTATLFRGNVQSNIALLETKASFYPALLTSEPKRSSGFFSKHKQDDKMNKALYEEAIHALDVAKLEWLSERYFFKPELYTDYFSYVLSMAFAPKNLRMPTIEWLITHGVDPNRPNSDGNTLADCILECDALKNDLKDVFERLKRYGITPENAIKKKGPAVLHEALSPIYFPPFFDKPVAKPTIKFLLHHGVNVNVVVQGTTPLLQACKLEEKGLIIGLLQYGANCHQVTQEGGKSITIYQWVQQNKPQFVALFQPYLSSGYSLTGSGMGQFSASRSEIPGPAGVGTQKQICIIS